MVGSGSKPVGDAPNPSLVLRGVSLCGSAVTRKISPDLRDATGHMVRELHGVTLAEIVHHLVDRLGWSGLGERIPVNCFLANPSIKSSLTFLRRTPWARTKVEDLYVELRSRDLDGTERP